MKHQFVVEIFCQERSDGQFSPQARFEGAHITKRETQDFYKPLMEKYREEDEKNSL